MATLYIKQKVFSWGDKFNIYDENGDERYRVQGEVFSLGKKLHIYDLNDVEVGYIHQKVWALLPRFFIARGGEDVAEVVKKFTFLKPKYTVEAFGWEVTGKFTGHEYSVMQGDREIVSVYKKWFTWGDTYAISIADGVDEINALAVALVIDACIAQSSAAAGGAAAAASN